MVDISVGKYVALLWVATDFAYIQMDILDDNDDILIAILWLFIDEIAARWMSLHTASIAIFLSTN